MPMNIDRKLNLLATENDVRPGDFPVGSAQSRAAARHLLKKRMEGRRRRETIIGIDADRKPSAGEYGEDDRGSGEIARLIGIHHASSLTVEAHWRNDTPVVYAALVESLTTWCFGLGPRL
jgi:hypothetical protein